MKLRLEDFLSERHKELQENPEKYQNREVIDRFNESIIADLQKIYHKYIKG
jgi:hypothetical protein